MNYYTCHRVIAQNDRTTQIKMYQFARKNYLPLLILISSIVFLITSFIYVQFSSPPSGDEPHYLIISQTLLKYHSLNVMLDYSNGDYLVSLGTFRKVKAVTTAENGLQVSQIQIADLNSPVTAGNASLCATRIATW